MMKFLLLAIALLLPTLPTLATAQEMEYPRGSIPVTASSGNVANASAAATIAAASERTNYICGFSVTSTGSTAAAIVSATLAGVIGGTMTFTYVSVAGATLPNQTLFMNFIRCVPASAANTAITFTLPALGAGNTNATVSVWGYRF